MTSLTNQTDPDVTEVVRLVAGPTKHMMLGNSSISSAYDTYDRLKTGVGPASK